MPSWTSLLAAAAALGLAALPATSQSGSGQPTTEFYSEAPGNGPPGTLLRSEPLPRPDAGGNAYRILYQSTDTAGRPIQVSGMVIVPDSPAPATGRPVIGWAHPTTGVVPACAPSLSPLRFLMLSGLKDMLNAGFIVAATDYPGLGAGTNHPFLDGNSEARAVLDAVRAAHAFPGAAANRQFGLWGHSQGGQAVLFAADIASRYAPDLTLAGVAAAAPATNLGTLLRDDLGTTGGNNLTALTLYAWARTYNAGYSGIIQPQAAPAVDAIAQKCIDTLIQGSAKREAEKQLATGFITVPDITAVEPWRSLIAQNSAPTLPPKIPVFLAQGTADIIVRPDVTRTYAARLCANGSKVSFNVLPGVPHAWIAAKSAKDAVSWLTSLLAGNPPPTNCDALPAVSTP